MKKFHVILALAALLTITQLADGQIRSEITLPPNGRNERAEVSQWIGLVKITIGYHSPNIHGGGGNDRTGHIWGELVHYGFFDDGYGPSHATPWRAGANESTTITFSHDVKVEGKDLKAGTYGLFLDVEKEGPWYWIFSTNSSGWGSFQYDAKSDALRVPVNPVAAPYTEFLTYGFDERRPASALAFLQWENKRIPFQIEVPNVNDLYVAEIRKDLQSWPGFNYENWQNAAQFCANYKVNLEEALVWAEKAITEPFRGVLRPGRANFSTLRTKAAVLEAMGRSTEADTVMDKALRFPETDVLPIYFYASGLLAAGRNQRALEVFTLNRQRHPDEQFWTYEGLAEAYTALSDPKNAINSWEIALRNVPEIMKSQVPDYENRLKQLKAKK